MSAKDGRRVTISAIAQEAGVSVPTVSRVVNGRSDVAPETRERVGELLQRHGYRRPASSRATSGLIDLVFKDLDSPWAVELIRGVEMVAHSAAVGTVVSAVHGQSASTRQWLQNLRSRTSDGVILVNSDFAPRMHAELQRLNVAVVVVDPVGGTALDVPTIGATNWAGGMAATNHLIALGHHRIGCVTGPPQVLCSRARLDGYRTALESAGIAVDDALVQEGDFYHESGFTGASTMLSADPRPTAIFAASDQMAFGVYEAVRRQGLRIPEDISVVGFDDLPQSQWASPPLTTVRQPLSDMGAIAARTILALARGEEPGSPRRMELSTDLVVRDSTAPAP